MSISQEEEWVKDIRDYCRSLNILTSDLYRIVTDLKVSPMIRGKAFEFSTYSRLKQILPEEEWLVTKPLMNAQTGTHDIDVMVTYKPTGKTISVECKLSGKGMFRVAKKAQAGLAEKDDYLIPVKCMRSRTTKTPERVASAARILGVTPELFLIHSDQYRKSSFHVVVTSIGNAFYETLEDDDGNLNYKFQPTPEGNQFIHKLNPPSSDEASLQEFVYNKVYLVRSSDIAVSPESGVVCAKRDCPKKHDCGFIPNYPVINFGKVADLPLDIVPSPKNGWVEIERAQNFFIEILGEI